VSEVAPLLADGGNVATDQAEPLRSFYAAEAAPFDVEEVVSKSFGGAKLREQIK
jgi:hypothetical protein